MNYRIELVNNETFDNADPQTRKTIVLLGISTYENMSRSDVMTVVKHNDDRLKHQQDLSQEYQSIASMNVKLNEDIKRLLEDRDNYVQEQVDWATGMYKERVRSEKVKMEIQQRLNTRLHEELERFKAGKTKSFVSIGENEVETFMGSMFSNKGILTNMTKTSENSDFHFEYNGVRLLIAVKNYTHNIPQRPAIDKFLRDTVSTKVDGSIIVSCVDGIRFPFRKSVLDWDFHQNIPTLYLTDFFSNPTILYGGILAMIHYVCYKKECDRDNNQTAQQHKDMYLDILCDIETWVPLVDKATKQAKSTWETMNDLNQKICYRLSKYDIF